MAIVKKSYKWKTLKAISEPIRIIHRTYKANIFLYMFQVRFKFGCYEEILQVEDEEVRHCNWVRFVTATTSKQEANVVATNHKGRVKFKVVQPINTNEEIKVLFDEDKEFRRKNNRMSLLKSWLRNTKDKPKSHKDASKSQLRKNKDESSQTENSENDVTVLYMRPISAKPSKPREPISLSPPTERRKVVPVLPSSKLQQKQSRLQSKSPKLLDYTSEPIQRSGSPPLPQRDTKDQELEQKNSNFQKASLDEKELHKSSSNSFQIASLLDSERLVPIRPIPIHQTPSPLDLPPPSSSYIPRSYQQLVQEGNPFFGVKTLSLSTKNSSHNSSQSLDTTKHDDSALSKGSLGPSSGSAETGSSSRLTEYSAGTSSTPGTPRKELSKVLFRIPKLTPNLATPGSLHSTSLTSTPGSQKFYTPESQHHKSGNTPKMTPSPMSSIPPGATPKMTPSPLGTGSTPGSVGLRPVHSTPLKDQGYASKENSDSSPDGAFPDTSDSPITGKYCISKFISLAYQNKLFLETSIVHQVLFLALLHFCVSCILIRRIMDLLYENWYD